MCKNYIYIYMYKDYIYKVKHVLSYITQFKKQ